MSGHGDCVFTPTEHAVHLDLIGRVHGYPCAEIYFDNLAEQDRTNKTYGALLHCYIRQRQTDKALSHLQKMKEMGVALSPLTYNGFMSLYAKKGENEKVYDVLKDMRNEGVLPDLFSYKICINAYGAKSDIQGMEHIFKEMESQPDIVVDWNAYAAVANHYIKAGLMDKASDALDKAEERLDNKDGLAYNHLISLYSLMGKTYDVLRIWDLQKSNGKKCINKDYIVMMQALARLGEFRECEELLAEWESSGNCYDYRVPDALVTGYCNKGSYDNAKSLLEELANKGRHATPDSWERVATLFLEKKETKAALYCMKAAISFRPKSKGWKPNPKLITSLLNTLGEEGSAEDVEAFVASLKLVVLLNREMYHALLKAYIRDHREVNGLMKKMKADGIDEDEETKEILSTKQVNRYIKYT